MTQTETTNINAKSGLAILFAAIDYHQSSLPASFSIASSASPAVNSIRSTTDHSMREYIAARAVNPNLLDEDAVMVGFAYPEQGTESDIKWIGEGNLSVRKHKVSRKSKKRSKNSKKSSTEMIVSIPLPDAAECDAISAIVSPAASTGSSSPAAIVHHSFGDGPTYSSPVETHHKKRMRCEAACPATPDEPSDKYRRNISIDSDDLTTRMKQQQLRLFYMSQQTKRSRAMLHMMRYDLMRIAEN